MEAFVILQSSVEMFSEDDKPIVCKELFDKEIRDTDLPCHLKKKHNMLARESGVVVHRYGVWNM